MSYTFTLTSTYIRTHDTRRTCMHLHNNCAILLFYTFPLLFPPFLFFFFLKVIYNEYFPSYFFALYLLPSLSSFSTRESASSSFAQSISTLLRLSPFRCKSTPPATVAFLLSLIFSFLRARDSTFFTNQSIFYGVGTGGSQLFVFSKARNASVVEYS